MKSVGQEKQDAWEEWNNLEQSSYEEEKRLKAEIEKKDKIIDFMAVCILAREIGKTYCQFNEKCTKYEHGRNIYCRDCIIQYFENKVNSREEKEC